MARLRICLIILITFFSAFTAWAAEPVFSIRYYNKKIYYPKSPIQLKVSLSNPGRESLSFRMADNKTCNFLLTLKNLKNETLPFSREYLINYDRNEPAFYRIITLEPGEEFGFILNLDSFVEIKDPGVYVLKARFFPDLKTREEGQGIEAPPLSLTIRPGIYENSYADKINMETGAILQAAGLAPDEVVEYILKARQKNQWNKFFLYMDLENIIRQDTAMKRQFELMNEVEQAAYLEDYREKLKKGEIPENRAIVEIPGAFEVLKTEYTAQEARVTVKEVFPNTGFSEIKRYTYYLHRFGKTWKIYRYVVQNMGTE